MHFEIRLGKLYIKYGDAQVKAHSASRSDSLDLIVDFKFARDKLQIQFVYPVQQPKAAKQSKHATEQGRLESLTAAVLSLGTKIGRDVLRESLWQKLQTVVDGKKYDRAMDELLRLACQTSGTALALSHLAAIFFPVATGLIVAMEAVDLLVEGPGTTNEWYSPVDEAAARFAEDALRKFMSLPASAPCGVSCKACSQHAADCSAHRGDTATKPLDKPASCNLSNRHGSCKDSKECKAHVSAAAPGGGASGAAEAALGCDPETAERGRALAVCDAEAAGCGSALVLCDAEQERRGRAAFHGALGGGLVAGSVGAVIGAAVTAGVAAGVAVILVEAAVVLVVPVLVVAGVAGAAGGVAGGAIGLVKGAKRGAVEGVRTALRPRAEDDEQPVLMPCSPDDAEVKEPLIVNCCPDKQAAEGGTEGVEEGALAKLKRVCKPVVDTVDEHVTDFIQRVKLRFAALRS